MTTNLTNPTPEQTANNVTGGNARALMSDKQIEAIGIVAQWLDDEADLWHYAADNLDLIIEGGLPALSVWPASMDKDPSALAVEFDADGDMRLFDYDESGTDKRWHRVSGSDVAGIISAAWRREFGDWDEDSDGLDLEWWPEDDAQ